MQSGREQRDVVSAPLLAVKSSCDDHDSTWHTAVWAAIPLEGVQTDISDSIRCTVSLPSGGLAYREAWAWGARLTTSTRRFSGPGTDWVHEIKHDGYRLIVRRDGGNSSRGSGLRGRC
jgi:hypothetical protein